IATGTNSVTISGVAYTKAESGIVVTGTRTSGDSLGSGASAPFTAIAAAPDHLRFGQQPTTATAGQTIAPAVTVRIVDANGNQTGSTASVTLAFGNNAGGGTLGGTLTQAAS